MNTPFWQIINWNLLTLHGYTLIAISCLSLSFVGCRKSKKPPSEPVPSAIERINDSNSDPRGSDEDHHGSASSPLRSATTPPKISVRVLEPEEVKIDYGQRKRKEKKPNLLGIKSKEKSKEGSTEVVDPWQIKKSKEAGSVEKMKKESKEESKKGDSKEEVKGKDEFKKPEDENAMAARKDPNYETLCGLGNEMFGSDRIRKRQFKTPAKIEKADMKDPQYATLNGLGEDLFKDDHPDEKGDKEKVGKAVESPDPKYETLSAVNKDIFNNEEMKSKEEKKCVFEKRKKSDGKAGTPSAESRTKSRPSALSNDTVPRELKFL